MQEYHIIYMLQKRWALLFFTNYFDGQSKLELHDEKYSNTIRKKLLTETYRKGQVIKRMRWKAIYYNEGKGRRSKMPGKSEQTCTVWKGFDCFTKERAFTKNTKKQFQKKLQEDIKMIRRSDKTMTFADKTNNM